MKILLPISLAVCAAFTGCLPPPAPGVIVAPGYHPHPYGPGPAVVGLRPPMPAPRVEVYGRPPFPGAYWVPGHWVFRDYGWFWRPGHWARRH